MTDYGDDQEGEMTTADYPAQLDGQAQRRCLTCGDAIAGLGPLFCPSCDATNSLPRATPLVFPIGVGALRRSLAFLVDAVLLLVVTTPLATMLPASGDGAASASLAARLGFMAFASAVFFAYFTCFEALSGTTPGKVMLRLRVVGPTGAKPTWRESSIRNAMKLLSALFLFLGPIISALMIETDKRHQRMGDDMAETTVVSARQPLR